MGNIMQNRVNLCRLATLVLFSGTLTMHPVDAANATAASCVYDRTTRTVTASSTGHEDIFAMRVEAGTNRILMNGIPCGIARRGNTELIRMLGGEGRQQAIVSFDLMWYGGSPEATGRPEIEFEVDLGTGDHDILTLLGSERREVFRYGTLGINFNNDDDADVTYTELDDLMANSYGGNDFLSAAAHPSTGEALSRHVTFRAGDGADVLLGGAGGAALFGDGGDDRMYGGSGSDFFIGGDGRDVGYGRLGNDVFEGGPTADGADAWYGGAGSGDLVSYANRTAPVSVSLDDVANDGGADEGDFAHGSIEFVRGGSGDDTLTGNARRNLLLGEGGNDSVEGLGGPDGLYGDDGVDQLFARDGEGDTVDGGDGIDTAEHDDQDWVNNVEVRR